MSEPESKIPKGIIPGTRKRTVVLTEPFWEKQRYEPAKALAAWQVYRDLEPAERSHKKVVEELAKVGQFTGVATVRRWARVWKWQVRLDAYLLKQDREKHAAREKFRDERFQAHTDQALAMQQIGSAKMNQRLEEIALIQKQADERGEVAQLNITDRDAVAFSKEGIMLERLAMGEATARIVTETPQMEAERKLRIAVTDIQTDIDQRQINQPDESADSYTAWLTERLGWAAEDYEVDYRELAGVFLGGSTTIPAQDAPDENN